MKPDDINEAKVLELMLEARKPTGRETLAGLVKVIKESGGQVVSAAQDPWDGDWCGTGVKFPWPPKRFDSFLEFVVKHHGILEVFPLGIPFPDEVLVRIKGMSNRLG